MKIDVKKKMMCRRV